MRVSDQVHNRHRLLKTIRSFGPISRIELAKATGLSGALITEVTADLLKRGLLVEQRTSAAQARGRPRTQLSINARGGLVIGATLREAGIVDIYFVDLAGNLLHSVEATIGNAHDLRSLAHQIAEKLNEAISTSGFARADVTRIAIALPGLVDSVNGMVHWMTTFDEPPFAFAKAVTARVKIPTTIENGSTCLARAEHWFGKARSLDDFSLFHVGVWIESAQYNSGMPRTGSNGFNSEIGHVKTDLGPNARTCLCGAKGCLALYGSVLGIISSAGKLADGALSAEFDYLSAYHRILAAAEGGDSAARQAFEIAGEHLGRAIADHINAFDPANVIVLMLDDRLLALIETPLRQWVARNVFGPLGDKTNIQLGTADADWRWKGVAAHALEQTYLGVAASEKRDLKREPSL